MNSPTRESILRNDSSQRFWVIPDGAIEWVLYAGRGEILMKNWSHISVSRLRERWALKSAAFIWENSETARWARCARAFVEHQVLFFRDQEITRDQHKAFGRHFGTLQVHPYLQPLRTRGIRSSWCCKATSSIRTWRRLASDVTSWTSRR